MTKVAPYIIQYIHLEYKEDIDLSLLQQSGYYLLFWWRQIPLGHLYIEQNQNISSQSLIEYISSQDFQEHISSAIKPTIDFYLSKHKLSHRYEYISPGKDYSSFLEVMDIIYSFYQPISIPAKVSISVIICTRNRSKDLQSCLERLHHQACLPEEIIVVDNAPTDDSTRKVVEKFKNVIYFKESRPGLDIARNTGAKLAKTPVVTYIDDDVVVHPLWAYRVWETFLNPNISAMTGLIIAATLETESQQIFEKFWGFNKGFQDVLYGKEYFEQTLADGPPVWTIGAGANMAFRKSVFDKVGFFDERLDVGAAGCSGDSEMWYRLLLHGHEIHYNPRAVSFHEHRRELPALRKQLFYYLRGFVAAALIQQAQNKKAGYRKQVYFLLPKNYFLMLLHGFPNYSFRYSTLFSELRGIASGILFYHKNKSAPSQKEK